MVGEGVGVGDGNNVEVDFGVGVIDVAGVAVGVATDFGSATPLFQINFLPDLMQVNFFPETVAV